MGEDNIIGEDNVETLGKTRVLVEYNDNNKEIIDSIRKISAELIDLIESHKKSREIIDGEIVRLYSNAMTEIEGACMWSIKAICK